MSTEEDEPGVPGKFDNEGKPYFFPSNQQRPADVREQRDGFVPRCEYRGHINDSIKGIQATGGDPFGRIRFVSSDGTSVHSWLEGGDGDSVKMTNSEHMINALTFVPPLNVVVAASEDTLIVFDGRTMRCLATLSTSKKVLLQLEYNQARDEIISGGSDGCFVWKLAAISCELSSLDAVLFDLTLLHGFKGSSSWAGHMVWDETSQVILTIDGMRVKTFDATTTKTTKVHTIKKAHESPVTVGLWIHESENIVTGCMGGVMKVWACQHTDVVGATGGRFLRRRKQKRIRSRRQGRQQQPALVESFGGHCGAFTGLVRHSLNNSYVVSSCADGTLRVWDVDRLSPITNVQFPYTMASLWATCLGGESRLLCAGTDGRIRTMVVRQVSQPLSFDEDGAQKLRYCPPFRAGGDEARSGTADHEHDGRDEEGYRIHDPEQHGVILVQKKHGLWGLMSESVLLPMITPRTTESTNEAVPLETGDESRENVGYLRRSYVDHERCEGETSTLGEGATMSSLFFAWPPLSCVVERYSHHVLSRWRRKVICITDFGVLDIYLFGPVNGEARKLSSRKIDLHSDGATATCMCLLPDTPNCVEATLDRLLASSSPTDATFDRPASGDADIGRGDRCGYRGKHFGGMGGKNGVHRIVRGEKDQVIAIGTSHGGVILVETVIGGTTLDYLEGVFASGVSHMAFCDASTDDVIRSEETIHDIDCPASFRTDSARLVCAGSDKNGTIIIKGLSVSSLMEKFSFRLVENPTQVQVGRRRPIVAIGYADGALNAIHFGHDRVHDLDGSALVGAHTTKINTIAFSTRHRCMASGSADGYIVIWDLNGQRLHTIYLQTPALAVAFMEVSGELLISSSSGMSRIPPCQWCPLRLLVANERDDRKAAALSSNNSGRRGSSGGAHRASDTTTKFSRMMVQDSVTSDGEDEPGVQIGSHPHHTVWSRRRRHVEHKESKLGGLGSLGGTPSASRQEAEMWNDAVNGLHGAERSVRSATTASNSGGKGDQLSGAIAEREWTRPEAVDSPSPFRWQRRSTPRGGAGSGGGSSLTTEPADRNGISILDRMNAKFLSLPTSPPPSLRAIKSTCALKANPPESPPSIYERLDGEEALGQAPAGERSAFQRERHGLGPTIGTASTSSLAEKERGGSGTTTPIADNKPVAIETGVTEDKPDHGEATNGTPSKEEERLHPGDSGRSVVGIDLAASASMKSSRTDCSPLSSSFLDAGGFLLNQHVAMPWQSARGPPCTTSLVKCPNDAVPCAEVVTEPATGDAIKPFFQGRGQLMVLNATSRRRLARDASPCMKHHSQRVVTTRAGNLASARLTPPPTFGLEPAENFLCSTETHQDTTFVSLLAPSAPACNPPLSDQSHGVPLTISPYLAGGTRRNSLLPASTPPMLIGGGIGAGTAAAIAAKDVHNVVPPASTARVITKPVVVGDLGLSVLRPPLSPSPPVSRAGICRAFGVISPRLWSEGSGDCCRVSFTPRFGDGEGSPWTPASQTGEGTRWGGIDGNGQHNNVPGSSNTTFFPVRPRPGRSIPVLFRNREQTALQS